MHDIRYPNDIFVSLPCQRHPANSDYTPCKYRLHPFWRTYYKETPVSYHYVFNTHIYLFRVFLLYVRYMLQQQIGIRSMLGQCVLLLFVGKRRVAPPHLRWVHALHPSFMPLQNKSQHRHHVQFTQLFQWHPIHSHLNQFLHLLPTP